MVGRALRRLLSIAIVLLLATASLMAEVVIPGETARALEKEMKRLYYPLSDEKLPYEVRGYEVKGGVVHLALDLSGTERTLLYEDRGNLERNVHRALRDVLLYNPAFSMDEPRLDYITPRSRSSITLPDEVSHCDRFRLENLSGRTIALYDVDYISEDAVVLQPVYIGAETTGLHLSKCIPLEVCGLVKVSDGGLSSISTSISYNLPIRSLKALFRIDSEDLSFFAGVGTTLSLAALTSRHFTLLEDSRIKAVCYAGIESLDGFDLKGGFEISYEHFVSPHLYWGFGYERLSTREERKGGIILKGGYAL